MNSPRYFIALACWCGLALSEVSASADLTTLMVRSPFMPPVGAGLAGVEAEPVGTLEFRGIVVEPEGTFFSVFDATASRGYWLREGMADGEIRVARYHSESCALEIEQNGRSVTLELKRASTAASAAVPVITTTATVPGSIRRTLRPRPTAVQPSIDQSTRMAQIAKEVRDRRALRQAAQTAQAAQGRPVAAPVSPGL